MRASRDETTGDHQLIDYHIKGRQLRWLKTLHIAFAAMWAGGTVCMAVVEFAYTPRLAAEMAALRTILWLVDLYVVAPSALMCMLTGFFYSAMTTFGFLKYWWIIVKWALTLAYNLAGFLILSPWLAHMARISSALPPEALAPPESALFSAASGVLVLAQLGVVGLMIVITIVKPWGHTRWHV